MTGSGWLMIGMMVRVIKVHPSDGGGQCREYWVDGNVPSRLHLIGRAVPFAHVRPCDQGSNEKSFFQSSFMLTTTQPFFLASSYSACVNVPTLVSGRPCAGP